MGRPSDGRETAPGGGGASSGGQDCDARVTRHWASILARSHQHVGDPGTAAVSGFVVVTRNVAHRRGRGGPSLDPFSSTATVGAPAT